MRNSMRKIIACALVAALALTCSPAVALAAHPTTDYGGDGGALTAITLVDRISLQDGNLATNSSATVGNVKVQVPVAINCVLDRDGAITGPTNAKLINYSTSSSVHVSNIEVIGDHDVEFTNASPSTDQVQLSVTPGADGRDDEFGSYAIDGGRKPVNPADWTIPPASTEGSELALRNISGIAGALTTSTFKAVTVGNVAWTIEAGSAKLDDYSGITWADGHINDVSATLEAAYRDEVDLGGHAGWQVGAERTVILSSMSATNVYESHDSQSATFVLMNRKGKTLAEGEIMADGQLEAYGDTMQCQFVVGLKNSLMEKGRINTSSTDPGGWERCARRTWCNGAFRDALPAAFRSLFKRWKVVTAADWGESSVAISEDWFALPAEKEIFGTNTNANSTAESDLSQFEWYKTNGNRVKKLGDDSSAKAAAWWERSPWGSGQKSDCFCAVGAAGVASYGSASGELALAPCGCI